MAKPRAGWRETAATALGGAALAGGLVLSGPGATLDRAFYDQALTRWGPSPPASAVIVAIDEPSFADIGLPWPWPRALHGRLIESLRAAGASAVGFDVLFVDRTEPEQDAALIAAAGPDIALGADRVVERTAVGDLSMAVEPLAGLVEAGARRGLVGVPIDPDGAMRALPPGADTLAAAILGAAGMAAPIPPPGALIAFPDPPGDYPAVSFYQALEAAEMLPPGLFEGRIALVGFRLRASADAAGTELFRTPWTARGFGLTAGVETQARILDTLAARAWVMPVPPALPPALTVLAAVAAAAAARRLGAAGAAASTVGGVAVWLGFSAAAMARGVWLPPAAPVLAALFAGAGQAGFDYARERAARHRITRAFKHYLAPAMVERLGEDPDSLRLGGEVRRLSILFCDLRGFTTLAETMKDDPEALVRLVNRALTPVVASIHAHDGAVDKFIGDCVMGLWNAPLPAADHAARAVAAGIDAVHGVTALARTLAAEACLTGAAAPRLAVGVGVNTGSVVVGNMGVEGRFDYTAIGDAVNLAARLEGLTRVYGVDMLVGEDAAAETAAQMVELDLIAVKGRRSAVRVYVPAALWSPFGKRAGEAQSAALAAYRARNWPAAEADWALLADLCPPATAYAGTMAARARANAESPPPMEWDGVFAAVVK